MKTEKSMDDILDSIRKIVHEEETGEPAAPRRVTLSEALAGDEAPEDTLVLSGDMRVDHTTTLNLVRSAQVTEDELEAIASLRLDSSAEDAPEETASLRLDAGEQMEEAGEDAEPDLAEASASEIRLDFGASAPSDEEAAPEPDEAAVAAFGAALGDDPVEKEAPEEAASVETDEWGFPVKPQVEKPYSLRRDDTGIEPEPTEAPATTFSLRLDGGATSAEAEPEEVGADDTPEVIILGAEPEETADEAVEVASAEAETVAEEVESEAVESAIEPDTSLSRDEIGQMVRSAVREELSGAMGDKITQNIRGMVRREIQRAMQTKQIK